MVEFMFATGIECSYPTIDGGRWRLDQLESTDHYRFWRRDLELVREAWGFSSPGGPCSAGSSSSGAGCMSCSTDRVSASFVR
jgi:hypothetical protein